MAELGYIDLTLVPPFDGESGMFGSKEHSGLLFIRSSFQCLQGLCLPDAPYLFALLLHRLEVPWARLFPIRLQLRLGAEFKCKYVTSPAPPPTAHPASLIVTSLPPQITRAL